MSSPERTAPLAGWTVVLPVKGGPGAKSRLGHPARARLAEAVALDTVAAVVASSEVVRALVVTADPGAAGAHAALGALVVRDPGGGLAGALAAGTRAAGGDPGPCALLLADLPALRAEDVTAVLRRCARALTSGAAQVTVPDADGTGTVLLAAATPAALRPRFGHGSAVEHAGRAVVLDGAPARLRRDVDTADHLARAVLLGVGPRTAAVLAAVAGTV